MNRYSLISVLFIANLSFLIFQSCNTENEGGCGETNISHTGDDESHNNGLNCMNCHVDGGEGEGCFVIAGSVYNDQLTTSLTNPVLKLYTEPQGAGQLMFTLNGDANGNFFTTDNVTYDGLYPSITGPSGTAHFMNSPLAFGACNSCHGSTTAKIWAD